MDHSTKSEPHLAMSCLPKKKTRLLSIDEKKIRYAMAYEYLVLILKGETNLLARMSTSICILNGLLESYFWTGFYLVENDGLVIGPYQGSMGCLRIAKGRGVCGQCLLREEAILVPDVHEFPGHIACDSASESEIVLPVFDQEGSVIAVMDVDSNKKAAFDEIDLQELTKIVALVVSDL